MIMNVCRQFATKQSCTQCGVTIGCGELVMRARHLVFHVSCFRCSVCLCVLCTGDRYGLNTADRVLCAEHYISMASEIAGLYTPTVHYNKVYFKTRV